ncbi:MAG TPA: dihydroorotate dehydrogenase electron transfer subunit [Candidatus Dormibacteraeota bacterium]|jgi:dihydroorotate dehydrogenase electron transfer subunit|nr:dihydroorotate dehydrogenase electron transfer subunit [Candidatus Dormibacteraeota bacterium]
MHDLQAPLVRRRRVAGDVFVLGFRAGPIAREVRAGQFVNVLLRPGPLLRRPFSVYRAEGELVELVLRAVGEGTGRLLELRRGDRVGLLGPLGRGFALDPTAGRVTLVSGGLGVAPMPMAAHQARAMGMEVCWVHGARTAADLCSEWEGDEVRWATEDGSQGVRGTALEAVPEPAGQVLACGPIPMLAALARRWPEAQVAVETVMACGTGVCLGCAVPLTSGVYTRACTEGPVYRAGSIDWERLPAPTHRGTAP